MSIELYFGKSLDQFPKYVDWDPGQSKGKNTKVSALARPSCIIKRKNQALLFVCKINGFYPLRLLYISWISFLNVLLCLFFNKNFVTKLWNINFRYSHASCKSKIKPSSNDLRNYLHDSNSWKHLKFLCIYLLTQTMHLSV